MTAGERGFPPSSFRVELSETGSERTRVHLLEAVGEVDLSCADELAESLSQFDGATDAGVVLDLQGVPFMDSSGLAVVMGAAERIGPRFAVVIAEGGAVDRLFELTEARSTLPTFIDVGEAIGSVGAPAAEA